MASKDSRGTPGATLETAISEITVLIEDAQDFITSELESEWDLAERYYKGETDLPSIENRSNVVKTEVRDAIRNTMPSIMRTLFHSRHIVEYMPTSTAHGMWAEQQADYVMQVFNECGGYMQVYTSVMEALKLKIGPQKVYWEPEPDVTYMKYTGVPFAFVESLIGLPDFEVESTELTDEDRGLYDVSGHKTHPNGRIVYEAVPNYEFFISRNVNSIGMALDRGVHGHRRSVTVNDAMAMGLEYDDWLSLDDEDPETSDHTSSSDTRRGYNKIDNNDPASVDVLKHVFTLTEAYVTYDLADAGRRQTYKFFFGGSSHKYIHHEEVEDSPYAIIVPIPIPHTVYGHSVADYTVKEQDTSTSVLRGTVDNLHASNNVKIAADPRLTNFDDVMNPALNAPIRKKAGDTLQVVQIPYTGQGNLGLLQYLDMDVQNKIGITKAAQGLDPDAMQSTDKNAVMNTIQTSQGQTELMVRNIIETGLIRVFEMMLRLSIQHMDSTQIVMSKGKAMPVSLSMFDPAAKAVPKVGLGTGAPQQRAAALQFIYGEQQGYMEKFGPNNPFTSFAQMYNTLEDLIETQGVYNVERYFNVVTPQVEKKWAEAQQKQQQAMMEQQQKNQPMDPSKAFVQVEAEKRAIDKARLATDHSNNSDTLRQRALTDAERLDIDRDKLVQERVIKLAEIARDEKNAEIQAEQKNNDKPKTTGTSSEKSA